jgi:hypothetical protein
MSNQSPAGAALDFNFDGELDFFKGTLEAEI